MDSGFRWNDETRKRPLFPDYRGYQEEFYISPDLKSIV